MTITVTQKRAVFKDFNNALEACWRQYGREDSKYRDLKRSVDEAYGILMGYIRALNTLYTEDELLRSLFTDMDGLWEVYHDRYWKALRAEV